MINVPIADSGTYYLRISPESPDSGDYELLIHTDPQATTVDPDFSGDGQLGCPDIDALVAEIAAGTDQPAFDLTGDGFVDLDDRDSWLTQAGVVNLPSGNPYLLGDADLNGVVDFLDFNIWAANRFQNNPAWCLGDFDASGIVDFLDFNIWATNRFQSSLVLSSSGADTTIDTEGSRLRDIQCRTRTQPQLLLLLLVFSGCGPIRYRWF